MFDTVSSEPLFVSTEYSQKIEAQSPNMIIQENRIVVSVSPQKYVKKCVRQISVYYPTRYSLERDIFDTIPPTRLMYYGVARDGALLFYSDCFEHVLRQQAPYHRGAQAHAQVSPAVQMDSRQRRRGKTQGPGMGGEQLGCR